MSARALILTAAAALVALGGLYLLIEVRSSGAAAPSEAEVAAKVARQGRPSPAATTRPRREETASIPRPTPDAEPPRKERSRFAPSAAAAMPTRFAPSEGKTLPPEGSDADFETAMLETNKLYDRHNYEDARAQALKLLERKPGTVRMLRVVVSSSCILGDAETAQRYWTELPETDRAQMTERCSRYDIVFANTK